MVARSLLGLFLMFVAMFIPRVSNGQSAGPVDVVLLMDMSGSMLRNRPRKSVKKIFAWGVELVNNNDRIAVVTLGDKSRVSQKLTKIGKEDDLSRLLHILTEKSNRTDVAAGLEQAYYMLKTTARHGAERVVVLFSDGKIDLVGGVSANERSARYMRDILIPAMKKERVRVFAFVPNGLSADYPFLQELTQRTNGEYFHGLSKTPPEFRTLLFSASASISPAARITEPPPATSKPPAAAPVRSPSAAPVKSPATPAKPPANAPKPPGATPAKSLVPESALATKSIEQTQSVSKDQAPVAMVELDEKADSKAQTTQANSSLWTIFIGLLVLGGAAFGAYRIMRARGQRQTLTGILEDVQELRGRLSKEYEEESVRLREEATKLEEEASREQESPHSNLSVSMVTPFLEFSDIDDLSNVADGAAADDIASVPAFSHSNDEPDLSLAMMETLIGVDEADVVDPSQDSGPLDEQGE
ncbi:MAG: VWA domain-containing protein [Deltaproteobacteria bacterium]|nr:VWA domain-containing protein [Deltaproteobacteria bacterium]